MVSLVNRSITPINHLLTGQNEGFIPFLSMSENDIFANLGWLFIADHGYSNIIGLGPVFSDILYVHYTITIIFIQRTIQY